MTGARGREPAVNLLRREFGLSGLVELRHQVERRALDCGLRDMALYRFVVAVNEITTNAVRHGGGHGRLELWRAARRLHCRITDHGPGLPAGHRPRRPGTHDASGRGLWLAQQSCGDLTIETGSRGTTVSLSVPAG
ncbi:ATP-binding protein [Actinoplanes sp. CA-030573]|uniref:ATP-binding protein n=1 Tax=Actinoplanes sp. CA-030573 TaxID=3239898 RepID=UPI003D8B320F